MKALTANAVSLARRTLVPVDAVPRSEKATDFHDAPHRPFWRKYTLRQMRTVTTAVKRK